MWGETTPFLVSDNFKKNVSLLRSVARIDISLLQHAVTDGTNYKLKEVYLYYGTDSGSVATMASNVGNDTVKAISLPANVKDYTKTYRDYSAFITNDTIVERSIYVTEEAKDGRTTNSTFKSPTFLVVGVDYKGVVSYYRIDISPSAKSKASERFDIKRNFRYLLRINQITGKGWDTPADAVGSVPWNVDWDTEMLPLDNSGGYVSGGYYFKTQYDVTVPAYHGEVVNIPYETNVEGRILWSQGGPVSISIEETSKTNGVRKGNLIFTVDTDNTSDKDLVQNKQYTVYLKSGVEGNTPYKIVMPFKLTQRWKLPQYVITKAVAHGIYLPTMLMGDGKTKKEFSLDANGMSAIHYIDITIKTIGTTDMAGKACSIKTNTVNGYSFACKSNLVFPASGQGDLAGKGISNATAGTGSDASYNFYTVRLFATGTPQTGGYNFFNLITEGTELDTSGKTDDLSDWKNDDGKPNTTGVRILCGYRLKNLTTYAWFNNIYGYATNMGGSRQFVDAPINFGLNTNSYVSMEGFKRSDKSQQLGGYVLGTNLISALSATPKPDIVILGFEVNVDDATKKGKPLKDYVDAGGVLIMFCDYVTPLYASNNVKNGVSTILGVAATSVGATSGGLAGANGYHAFVDNTDSQGPATDDILMTGPFGRSGNVGTLFGKYWGEDASTSTCVTGLGSNTGIIVYSRGSTTNVGGTNPSIFRTKGKGFLFVGDGGFISQSAHQAAGYTSEPFFINSDKTPAYDGHYIISSGYGAVYNSHFFANTMYWAVNYSEFYGPNSLLNQSEYSGERSTYESVWEIDKMK
jgi:hypothetical protein